MRMSLLICHLQDLLFSRGMPPCLRRFLWPQSLLMASQHHAHGGPRAVSFSLLDKNGGAARSPLRAIVHSNTRSSSVHHRISQAIGAPPADAFYIFCYEDFLLLQAEASRAAQHTKHQRLRHPGSAAQDKPGAAAPPPAAAVAAAASLSAIAGVADSEEACLASMAQLVAATTESSQSTAACNTRECSSCSNASGRGVWSAAGDTQSFGETAVSCTADVKPQGLPPCSTCERHRGSASACKFISHQERIWGKPASETERPVDPPAASLRMEGLSSPGDLQQDHQEGPPQLMPQIRIYNPVPGSPPSADEGGAGTIPSAQPAASRPIFTPNEAGDREDVAAATADTGYGRPGSGRLQEDSHFPSQRMLTPAAANATPTTHRDRAHLRRLRHALPRVYPQLQQLPQRYGSLVLPECSAEQLMALASPEANESYHFQQGRHITARHCHCCCPPRSRPPSGPYYSCTYCANPTSPGPPPTSDSFLPLPRCSCCQETVAAASRVDVAPKAPQTEAAKARARRDDNKDSPSSSSQSSSTSDRPGSRPSMTSTNDDCGESIGAGLRSVMESLFLLLPDVRQDLETAIL